MTDKNGLCDIVVFVNGKPGVTLFENFTEAEARAKFQARCKLFESQGFEVLTEEKDDYLSMWGIASHTTAKYMTTPSGDHQRATAKSEQRDQE